MSLSTEQKKYAYAAAAVTATAVAGYAIYKFISGAPEKLGQEMYYDGKEAYTFLGIINRTNQSTGNGEYPELIDEVCPETGRKYKRGNPKNDEEPFILRNEKMWKHVLENMPKDRKIRGIELGSGRGNLSRYIALKLHQMGKLESWEGVNLAATENKFNLDSAKAQGIPVDKYNVLRKNFDDLSFLKDDHYDVIVSNEALYHAMDHAYIGRQMARILRKGGATVFTDFLHQKGASRADYEPVLVRFHQKSMPSLETYDTALQGAGMKKILLEGDNGYGIIAHFGMQLWTATVYKRDELLGPNGVSKEFFDWKMRGIHEWIDFGEKGLLENGMFVYKKV